VRVPVEAAEFSTDYLVTTLGKAGVDRRPRETLTCICVVFRAVTTQTPTGQPRSPNQILKRRISQRCSSTPWPEDKIDYARLLREQGSSFGEITSKTGIPKTSLHRYLTPATEQE
jgi:hypothetical protein